MLRANVSLSRKITRDFNSSGYAVNVEGELTGPTDQPGVLLQQIQGLFRIAEEALAHEVDRDQGEQAIGRRDEEQPQRANGNSHGRNSAEPRERATSKNSAPSNQTSSRRTEPATDKQVNYLETIGKRQKLSRIQLEARIAEILGNRVGLYELTKKEAGTVIDALTKEPVANGQS
jgi:hypothetical protein